MVKALFRLLIVALLVMVPAAILATGNAAWIPVYSWSVVAYTAIMTVSALLLALDLRAASGFKRSDFGEKAHERIIRYFRARLYASTQAKLFTPVVGFVSVVLALALNLLPVAGLIVVCVCTQLLCRGAVDRYVDERGGLGKMRPARS